MVREFVKIEQQGDIARLILARAQRRNALSYAMLLELQSALQELATARARVLVLAADGPVFCSGHDFADLAGKQRAEIAELVQLCTHVMQLVRALPMPSIAAVQGGALGAGCQLALTCDLIVAADDSYFQTPGGKGGWFCTTPGVAVARSLGACRALEMLLLGEPVVARQALEWGMINRICPREKLTEVVAELAAAAAKGSRAAKAFGKSAFYKQCELVEHEAYSYATEAMIESAMFADAQENFRAFVEKRQPKFGE
ncbi:MAG: enoyl-CoA hydratase/isomerase family protein [Oligoflexia bacterium]|nr:enoyl-CoA hydratase/isomerase family protein [Oligoflexia bacterium]